jgi:hypothetical protein
MKRIRFSKEAAEEFKHAVNWYETECRGLGTKLYNSVDSALQLLKEDSPHLFPSMAALAKKARNAFS